MYDRSTSIDRFLDNTSAKQPIPGGGSVTALAGALSAAIGEMVLNYSVGKKGLELFDDELKKALAELHRARQMMLELMEEDQHAYQELTAARKLPADSPERAARFPAAVNKCIRIPESISGTGAAILGICEDIAQKVNHYLLSDLAVCADLAMATVRCGFYNVRVNLSDVANPEERTRIESEILAVLGRAGELIQRVSSLIWTRQRSEMAN